MKWTGIIVLIIICFRPIGSNGQLMVTKETFTRADTLRGSVTKYREGWDVIKYDLTVTPDISEELLAEKMLLLTLKTWQ